jgi:hypothetical protein
MSGQIYNGHPFRPGSWYELGELRRVVAEMHLARRADPALSAMMRAQSRKWAKEWTEELYPLCVLADHKAFADDDRFCWTPDGAADFTLRLCHGGTIKVQNTVAFAEWPDSVGEQGGHLHKLEMLQTNKKGFAYLGGRVTEPTVRDPFTDADAWRNGIANALKKKLRPEYAGLHLAIFAQRCSVHMIETSLEQVASSAVEQVGRAECQRIFGGLYVFDSPPGLFFELSHTTSRR